jgi:hypothetical protein
MTDTITQEPPKDYGLEIARRKMAIDIEFAEFDARKKRETEQVWNWFCRYGKRTEIAHPKVTFCNPGGVQTEIFEIPKEENQ